MTMRFHVWLTAAALGFAAPASAADLALVLDAGSGEAEQVSLLGDALNAQGYEVTERSAAGRSEMREAIESFAERLGEAERIVIVFAGAIHAHDGSIWLLPADFEGEGRIAASFDGVALDLLTALAAERPGRSAVILAYDEADVGEAEDPAEAADPAAQAAQAAETAQGWARADVPQGVLVLAGARAAALDATIARLLEAELSAAEAVADLEEVRVYGFASPDMGFGAPMADAQEIPTVLAESEGAVDALAPPPAAEPTPQEAAEAGEDALALDRVARRSIQEDLTVLGFSTRGTDGIFGPGTRTAIREWQQDEGYEATGFLDAEQIARLRQEASVRSAELREQAERTRAAEEAADAAFWRTTGAGGTAADLRTYLSRYPDGIYASEARAQLDALEAEARREAEAEDRAAWDQAMAEGTPEALRRYLEGQPEGAFRGEAVARLEALEEAPQREAALAEAAAREEALGLSTASRTLIEGQLAAVGHDVGATDGMFDEDTRRAIREFQTRQGLQATGYIDQETVQALLVASLGLR